MERHAIAGRRLTSKTIEDGGVLRVMPGRHAGVSEINVVHLTRRPVTPRLRVFIELLVEKFKNKSLIGVS